MKFSEKIRGHIRPRNKKKKKKEEKRTDKLKNFYSTIYFTGIEQSNAGSKRKTGYVWLSNGEITLGVIRSIPEAIPRLKESRVAFKVLRRDLCNLFRARNCRVKLANSPGEASRGSGQQTACTCQLSSARNGRYLRILNSSLGASLTAQFDSINFDRFHGFFVGTKKIIVRLIGLGDNYSVPLSKDSERNWKKWKTGSSLYEEDFPLFFFPCYAIKGIEK